MLTTVIILIIIAIVIAFIFLTSKLKKVGEYKKADFLSSAELKFFRALDNTLGNKYKIFIKPKVSDLITANASDRTERSSLFGKIKYYHVDFILCDTNINPLCIIELDDRSHNSNKVIKRDNFLNNAFASAGIPIAHFPVRSNYSNIEIENKIKEVLPDIQQTNIPKCPNCGSHMIKRTAKSGENAGYNFGGCSNYPSCRGIVNIET